MEKRNLEFLLCLGKSKNSCASDRNGLALKYLPQNIISEQMIEKKQKGEGNFSLVLNFLLIFL